MGLPWKRTSITAATGGACPPFSPLDISGLKLWLDASAITGLNNNDSVTTWADISGNGNDVTQSTGSKKPTYQTNQINGLPAVVFDGVDDQLENSMSMAAGAKTLVVIGKLSGGAINYPRAFSGKPDTTFLMGCASTGKNLCLIMGNGSGSWNSVAANTPTTSWNAVWLIAGLRTDGTTLTPRANATTLNTTNGSNPTALTGVVVGAAPTGAGVQWWTGPIHAVLAYDRDIGSGAMGSIFSYYRTRTAIY